MSEKGTKPFCFEWLRNVDIRLPGKGNSNSHGARPVHLIMMMIDWIWTSRLSIKNPLSLGVVGDYAYGTRRDGLGGEEAGDGQDGPAYRGTSLIRKHTHPRTAIGPYAYTYCRILRSSVFL